MNPRLVTLIFLSLAALAGCGSKDDGGDSSEEEAPKLTDVTALAGPCSEDGCLVSVMAYTDVDDLDTEKWQIGVAGISQTQTAPKECANDKTIDMSIGVFTSAVMDPDTYYAFRVCIINAVTGERVGSKTTSVKTRTLD